jgi:UDP-2,3-diacylglucosamine pyrophosphatase LpxH
MECQTHSFLNLREIIVKKRGDPMSVASRLSEVLKSSEEISFDNSSKFILVSDCHRGDNSWADDFAPNQNIFFHALNSYFDRGFTYIEIGDGEELWENRYFEDIRRAHSHIYWKLSQFYEKGRLYLIWGNHNREWKDPRNVKRYLSRYKHERRRRPGTKAISAPLFDGIRVHEGLVLHHMPTNRRIFLTHGHQGDLLNDEWWWVGRFIVRGLWKVLQIVGVKDPTSPAKNFKKRVKLEEQMVEWLERNRGTLDVLIVGHTHRPYLPGEKEAPYCNTGSCVHPRSITGIEIENGQVRLIKWFIDVNPGAGGILFVNREILEGPRRLEDFV